MICVKSCPYDLGVISWADPTDLSTRFFDVLDYFTLGFSTQLLFTF